MKCGQRVPQGRVKIGAEEGRVLDLRMSVTRKGKKGWRRGYGKDQRTGEWRRQRDLLKQAVFKNRHDGI